jgi:hypothetical protein
LIKCTSMYREGSRQIGKIDLTVRMLRCDADNIVVDEIKVMRKEKSSKQKQRRSNESSRQIISRVCRRATFVRNRRRGRICSASSRDSFLLYRPIVSTAAIYPHKVACIQPQLVSRHHSLGLEPLYCTSRGGSKGASLY